jgi:hypothetical protein
LLLSTDVSRLVSRKNAARTPCRPSGIVNLLQRDPQRDDRAQQHQYHPVHILVRFLRCHAAGDEHGDGPQQGRDDDRHDAQRGEQHDGGHDGDGQRHLPHAPGGQVDGAQQRQLAAGVGGAQVVRRPFDEE